jgi:hypothetical protein
LFGEKRIFGRKLEEETENWWDNAYNVRVLFIIAASLFVTVIVIISICWCSGMVVWSDRVS